MATTLLEDVSMFCIIKNIDKRDKKIFFCLLALSLFYVFPLIMDSRLYIDDLSRSLYGNAGWSSDGRPLATAVMKILNGGTPLLNLSPITLILSIITLCFSLMLYAKYNLKDIKIIGVVFCLFGIICNPFFIENLSYKYDCLPMSLSIASVLLVFCNDSYQKWTVKNFGAPIIFIIFSLCLYQATIGMFFIFLIIEIILSGFSRHYRIKNIFYTLAWRSAQVFIAYFLYKYFIVKHYVSGNYASNHAEMVNISMASINIIVYNVKNILGHLYLLYKSYPVWVLCVVIVGCVFSIVNFILLTWKKNKSVILCFFIILAYLAMFLFSFIHLALLKNPVLAPRVFISVGSLFAFYVIGISYFPIKEKYKTIFIVPLLGTSFLFSYAYSNASSAQEKIDNLIATSIYHDINSLKLESNKVSIYGKMPVAKEVKLSAEKIPLINRLIPIYMDGSWWWGAVFLQHYRIPVWIEDMTSKDVDIICHSKPMSDTRDYKIFVNGDKVILLFEKYNCN